VVAEAFADRAYADAFTLVPRGRPGAVLTDPDQVVRQAVRMAVDGEVVSADGRRISLTVESLCVHGDTPGAVTLAGRVRSALLAAGVRPARFLP
jgi:UPF0271 protein